MMDKTNLKKLVVASSERNKEKNFWLNKLSNDLSKVNVPYDFSRSDKSLRLMDKQNFKINGKLFSRIMTVSGKSDNAIFIILTAGLKLFLNKYTELTDIIIGTPILKQNVEGEFINTILALRTQLNDNMTFKDLLMAVSRSFIEANENQNYPMESLLYQLGFDFPGNEDFPLFDIAILLENLHDKNYLRDINVNMTFALKKCEDSIEGTLEYNALLYKETTIRRTIDHYLYLLEQAIFSEKIPIDDLTILSEEEKKRILGNFNESGISPFEENTIYGLFEEQTRKTPHNIALIESSLETLASPLKITYDELNDKCDCLSSLLTARGVQPGNIIAIMVDRSLEMIIGLIGIMKAGAGYLPIDPHYPEERITYMLADSNARILISTGNFTGKIETLKADQTKSNFEPIYLDAAEYIAEYINIKPAPMKPLSSTSLAYIIYTSGSTGKPKGVMVEHRSVVNMLTWRKDIYQMGTGDIALQLFSYAFDGFVTSMFTPLISGAAVVLLSEDEIKDVTAINNAITGYKVSHFIIVPQLLLGIIENLSQDDASSIKTITLAGDTVPAKILEIIKEKNFKLEIAIEYGVTEASVMTTIYRCRENEPQISIGKPIRNSRVYIVNNQNRLQPIGVAGEIWIGGVGPARGYLNRPQLTAEKFVDISKPTCLFTAEYLAENIKPLKIYKTGDLGLWQDDGNIKFLGRIDHQVKIRGFRIETAEIENQLLNYGHIGEAAVLARADNKEENYLCAYYVSDKILTVSELRDYLSRSLPDYMIPSYFVQMEKMPLNANGKLDRKSLPKPEIKLDENYIAPRNNTELSLADIWARILDTNIERLSIDANFFEIGGHSLNTINLISDIYKVFHVKVSINDIFEKPTIRLLAQYIQGLGKQLYVSLDPVENKDFYPLSPAQKRLFVAHQMDNQSISYNLPQIIGLAEVDKQKLENAFNKVIMRHESLRTSFEIIDGEPVQKIHDKVEFKVTYFDLNINHIGVKDIIRDFVQPFDLSKVPLLRVAMVKKNDGRHLLLFDMHHIITDAVSARILARDLMILYNGGELSPLRLQYKDYCQWQNSKEIQQAVKAQVEYWVEQYKENMPVLNLPLDYPRPEIQSHEGDTLDFILANEKTKALKSLVKEEDVTLFILLLAILNVMLAKICRQEDIVVGTNLVGRRHADLEGIIGFFVNQLPLRNFPVKEKTFNYFLGEVKRKVLESFENQDCPPEELVNRLGIKKNSARHPLFDIVFTLHKIEKDYEKEIEKNGGLTSLEYRYQNPTAKYDMVLSCIEGTENLFFTLEYAVALFKKETINRFITYFKDIVDAVVENKYIRLEDIRISNELVEINSHQFHDDLEKFEF